MEHTAGRGDNRADLLTAWIAKENLRNVLALARTGADRHQIGHARWKFLTWCADADIPRCDNSPPPSTDGGRRPKRSSTPGTATPSEGINHVIKLVVPATRSSSATPTTNDYGHAV
ncbi:hypothetical protein GCM10010307_20010 [Streptomyces vastus]|uniref:Transposase n=1 Tax=Streptomyces vastus TaxID=285451 RepID=A0ABP6CYK8_9ACTN